MEMARYKIVHSHGQTDPSVDTYEEALGNVRSVYGDDCEIGHSGDISDGGDSTLVWIDAETAENDDGSRACCRIYKVLV